LLEQFKVNHLHSSEINSNGLTVVFTEFDEPREESQSLVIYCPLVPEKDDKAEAALNLLEHTQHGLWVGLNNGMNAALAAIEILNLDNKFESQLLEYRREQAEKVRGYNKKIDKGQSLKK